MKDTKGQNDVTAAEVAAAFQARLGDEAAIAVLDAWAQRTGGFWSNGFASGKACCFLHMADGGKQPHRANTPAEARVSAAGVADVL